MAAPSSTVPGAGRATGPSPTSHGVSALKIVQEVAAGTASLLQEIPPEVLPVVGSMCKTFLAFEELVATAKSNNEALSVLHELCDVVVKGVLVSRKDRPGLPGEGYAKLKEHVERANEIAKLCNGAGMKGSVKRFVLARKISNDIAAVRGNVLAFCSVNNLVLADDAHVSKLESCLVFAGVEAAGPSLILFRPNRSLCARNFLKFLHSWYVFAPCYCCRGPVERVVSTGLKAPRVAVFVKSC